jgi:hypothetical protein
MSAAKQTDNMYALKISLGRSAQSASQGIAKLGIKEDSVPALSSSVVN